MQCLTLAISLLIKEVANSLRSVHLSPSYPSAQLQVSFATQAPFSHGGSHTTGVGTKEEH